MALFRCCCANDTSADRLCVHGFDITLRVHAHLFQKDNGKAAAAINAALSR
jgi:hypothetical protein